MKDFVLVHTDDYNNWVFSANHPTQGRRFMNAKGLLLGGGESYGFSATVVEPRSATKEELALVHAPDYIDAVMQGYSGEWEGQREDLGAIALKFAGGTLTALDSLKNGETLTAVHFAGAKHHAQYAHSSGFCVLADFAMAATMLAEEGKKVAILDIDAHHGDGTENLTYDSPSILTFSVHEENIFPFTGYSDDAERFVFNRPLPANSGGAQLMDAVQSFIDEAHKFNPDYIFIAGGADGHRLDPLSSLQYEISSITSCLSKLRSEFPATPILFGGAGGYRPDDATPAVWASAVLALVQVEESK